MKLRASGLCITNLCLTQTCLKVASLGLTPTPRVTGRARAEPWEQTQAGASGHEEARKRPGLSSKSDRGRGAHTDQLSGQGGPRGRSPGQGTHTAHWALPERTEHFSAEQGKGAQSPTRPSQSDCTLTLTGPKT